MRIEIELHLQKNRAIDANIDAIYIVCPRKKNMNTTYPIFCWKHLFEIVKNVCLV